jgi:uncharacterized protein YjbI with pentapeptide repeats
MKAEELLERYAAGERNFIGLYIDGSDELCGADLSNTNFRGAVFDELLLEKTNFSHANLRGVIFGLVGLRGANLQGADLCGASIGLSELGGANLTASNLAGAYLEGTSLGFTNLTRANLSGAQIDDGTDFEGAIFYETIMPDGSIRTNER